VCSSSSSISLLRVAGRDFVFPVSVFIRTEVCEILSFTATQILCVLPLGTGFNHSILVTSQEESYRALPLLSVWSSLPLFLLDFSFLCKPFFFFFFL
jgi:hypothetical protein